MAINKLILGDCLEVLKTLENETVDLIYIDPPFFSNRTYEVIWGDKGEIRSFEDRFFRRHRTLYFVAQRTNTRNAQNFETNGKYFCALRPPRQRIHKSFYFR